MQRHFHGLLGAAMRFTDRAEAGRALAARLTSYANRSDVVVLGLPRGGVPVAAEVARALAAPLDVLLVRKLGAPDQPELAIGAIAEDGVALINEDVLRALGLGPEAVDRIAARERPELERRLSAYRAGRPGLRVEGRIAIVVDDGLATGASMEAACRTLAARSVARLVVAVPVATREACDRLRTVAHEVIAVATPAPFYAVGAWYVDFSQTDDREVVDLLTGATR
jgi:predicted phosphoribosyltransferase